MTAARDDLPPWVDLDAIARLTWSDEELFVVAQYSLKEGRGRRRRFGELGAQLREALALVGCNPGRGRYVLAIDRESEWRVIELHTTESAHG